MKSLSGTDLARILERNGWTLARVRGSHHVYVKSGSKVRLSVPIHSSKPLREGLLKYLLKVADIAEDKL